MLCGVVQGSTMRVFVHLWLMWNALSPCDSLTEWSSSARFVRGGVFGGGALCSSLCWRRCCVPRAPMPHAAPLTRRYVRTALCACVCVCVSQRRLLSAAQRVVRAGDEACVVRANVLGTCCVVVSTLTPVSCLLGTGLTSVHAVCAHALCVYAMVM